MHRPSQNRMKKKITKSVFKLTGLQSGMRRQPVKVPQKLTGHLGKVKRGWRRSQRGAVSRIKKSLTQPSSQRCPPLFFYHCTPDSEWQVHKCFTDSRVLHIFQWLICLAQPSLLTLCWVIQHVLVMLLMLQNMESLTDFLCRSSASDSVGENYSPFVKPAVYCTIRTTPL